MKRKTKAQWLCVNDRNVSHADDVNAYPKQKVWAARFRDVLIQSSVIVGGSGDKALSGKMYNTGVWLYKLPYEAFIRKLFNTLC